MAELTPNEKRRIENTLREIVRCASIVQERSYQNATNPDLVTKSQADAIKAEVRNIAHDLRLEY